MATRAARTAHRDEAQRLLECVDWRKLVSILEREWLLAQLGERIVAIANGGAPEWFAQATQAAIATGAERDSAQTLVSMQLLHSLRAADIPAMALKGPPLGEAIYGRAGRRPSFDIDLLVAAEHLRKAIAVAQTFGYGEPKGATGANRLPLLHFRLRHAQLALPPLELHWRICTYEHEFSRDLLARSVDAGARGRRATLGDEFTSLLLFFARDGFTLRWACDLAAWWDTFGAELAPGALGQQLARYPALKRSLLAATEVAQRLAGLPSGPLLGPQRLERRVRLAARLAHPVPPGSITPRGARDIWLVDWLLTPPGAQREAIRRQLAPDPPPPGVLRAHPALARGVAIGRLLGQHVRTLAAVAYDEIRRRAIRTSW